MNKILLIIALFSFCSFSAMHGVEDLDHTETKSFVAPLDQNNNFVLSVSEKNAIKKLSQTYKQLLQGATISWVYDAGDLSLRDFDMNLTEENISGLSSLFLPVMNAIEEKYCQNDDELKIDVYLKALQFFLSTVPSLYRCQLLGIYEPWMDAQKLKATVPVWDIIKNMIATTAVDNRDLQEFWRTRKMEPTGSRSSATLVLWDISKATACILIILDFLRSQNT